VWFVLAIEQRARQRSGIQRGKGTRFPVLVMKVVALEGVPLPRYTSCMPSTKPRVQVTVDDDLASAVAEFGADKSSSRAIHDLAVRGAEAIRAEAGQLQDALDFLGRLDSGEDDRFDFSVSAKLHAGR